VGKKGEQGAKEKEGEGLLFPSILSEVGKRVRDKRATTGSVNPPLPNMDLLTLVFRKNSPKVTA